MHKRNVDTVGYFYTVNRKYIDHTIKNLDPKLNMTQSTTVSKMNMARNNHGKLEKA